MANQNNTVDMTKGSILKHLLNFTVPLLIGQIFQQLYNTIDSIVVGKYVSTEALAAVGSTGSVINATIGFFIGLSAGAGVIISRRFGARDYKGVSKAVHTAVALITIMSVFLTAIGLLGCNMILKWVNTPDNVFQDASDYLSIYFAGVSGVMFYNIGSGILRAVGDSRRPLYFLIFSALLNLVLDITFVRFFQWGISGAAWATVISQCLSAILTFTVLFRSQEACRVSLSQIRIDKESIYDILKVGIPTGLQTGIVSLSNAFVQGYINEFQSDCMAGWTSYNKLDAFVWLPMAALGNACTTFVGQNLGAGKKERAFKGTTICMQLATVSTAFLVAVVLVFARQLLSLFGNDEEMYSYGIRFIYWISPFYVINGFNQIYSGALRGSGKSLPPMIICISSFVLFRQAYLYIGTNFLNIHDPVFVGLSYPAGWIVASIAIPVAYIIHKKKLETADEVTA